MWFLLVLLFIDIYISWSPSELPDSLPVSVKKGNKEPPPELPGCAKECNEKAPCWICWLKSLIAWIHRLIILSFLYCKLHFFSFFLLLTYFGIYCLAYREEKVYFLFFIFSYSFWILSEKVVYILNEHLDFQNLCYNF